MIRRTQRVAAKTKFINWQRPMTHLFVALAPIAVSAVYFFGWRALLVMAVANAAGFAVEYAFVKQWKQPVTSAVFVTNLLFALSLPPSLPIWMVALGAAFAVLFGKMVFGGFGKNIFNPALTGRAFIYISFGNYMTAQWNNPGSGVLGGLTSWLTNADAITTATPGMSMKLSAAALVDKGLELPTLMQLFLGNTAGVLGGTSALLVILGGVYITYKKAANYRIVISALAGFLITQTLLWAFGVRDAIDPLRAMLAGSVLFGIFFFATEPVSACKTNEGRWIYGAFIGSMTSLIALFSPWPAGTMFAVLLANMFAPITDYAIGEAKKARKAKAA